MIREEEQTKTIRESTLEKRVSNRISWFNRLNTRFQLTLIAVLLITFAASQYLLFSKQKVSIYQEEQERAAFMADGLSRSLQTLMLSGNASYAVDWLDRISNSPELISAQVIRNDQREAFLDGDTLSAVNRYLESDLFTRPLHASRQITDIDSHSFAKATAGEQISNLDEENGTLTFLLPIKSGDECLSCHGYDPSNVRGVLRITTSIAHAQQRIDQALQDTLFYGLSVTLVIGLLLSLFIRRQILFPLEQITEAATNIAVGDLETSVDMHSKNEIGRLGESFNYMTEALKSSTVSRGYFETIMSSMGEMLFVTDLDQHIEFANPSALTTLGYEMDELEGKRLNTLIKGDMELTKDETARLSQAGEFKSIERQFFHKAGHEIPVLITITMMQHGDDYLIVSAGRDITEMKLAEKELRLAAKVMECDSSAILICDANANIVLVNPAFCEITGYSKEEVIGKNPRILSSGKQPPEFYKNMWNALHNDGMWEGEIWNRRKTGGIYPERLSITVVRNDAGEIINFVSLFTDITEQKDIEQRLSHLAHHDALTGLPNRTLFTDRLEHALAHASRGKHKVGLMFIDIDGFKGVNDTHGHDIGDALLCAIADTLSELVRDADTVARVGGDEFVIILENLTRFEDMILVADKILQRFSTPTMAAGIACDVGCSVGIATGPDDSNSADELVKMADTAMYLAKTSGKQQYRIYSQDCIGKETQN